MLARTLVSAVALLPALAYAAPRAMGEARANLKAAYVAQRAYYQEKDTFSTRVLVLGFLPERGNRYSYYLAPSGPAHLRRAADALPLQDDVIIAVDQFKHAKATFPKSVAETGCPVTGPVDAPAKGSVGVTEPGPRGEFLILAAGNLDGDAKLDCWSIASFPRRAANGAGVPAGEPLHEQSDLTPAEEEKLANAEKAEQTELLRTELRATLAGAGVADPKAADVFVAFSQLTDGLRRYVDERGAPPDFATLASYAGVAGKDPWGRPYRLIRVWLGTHARVELVAVCAGPDGVIGTDDDLALSLGMADRKGQSGGH